MKIEFKHLGISFVLVLMMACPVSVMAESHLTWSMNAREMTPYIVEKDHLSKETTVYNLRTGETGMNIKDFGTYQTGRHTDPTMEILLREGENEAEDDD